MNPSKAEFTNWSGQYKSTPDIYTEPETIEDLQEIVKNKEAYPSPVVAIGSGHSNSGCNVVNGGTAVNMKKFHYINEPGSNYVTAGAGIQLFELHRFLAQRNLQIPFTPEIGNATLGSVACCCLKDASIGQSSGIASGMIKEIKYVDSNGGIGSLKRGDKDWQFVTSSHGLFFIIYEVTLDITEMKLVIQNYVSTNAHKSNFESVYKKTLAENDGVFGLMNATNGKLILETRNFSKQAGKPGRIANIYNQVDRNVFKYFNPIVGTVEKNWWSRMVRNATMAGFGFMKLSFTKGRKTFKNLKPIDYSHKYRFRWDFHFWAYPVSEFPTVVLPAFFNFMKEFKRNNPAFDEKGLFACYRIRIENNAILSPSFDEERMTLDPVRPMTRDEKEMAEWDKFCYEYNEFAVKYGGKCTFNQTKVLAKHQVEKAFGEKWTQFKAEREKYDQENRFLSNYFKELMY